MFVILFFGVLRVRIHVFEKRIVLGYHIGTLSQDPECASLKLVDKMAETVILFGLVSGFLNRELQLTLHFAHE
jgi:hypothetical protein